MLSKRIRVVIFFLVVLNGIVPLQAQVVASFEVADTVCVGEEVLVVNTSIGGDSFHWNFCVADLDVLPQPESLGDLTQLNTPTYMTIVEEDGAYFGFVSNYNNHKLIRLDFGNSLSNTPDAINLGAFPGIVHTALQGISVHKDNGQWWGYAVTGYATNPSLIRYTFGTSITNIPTAETLGNVGGMNFPHELFIFEENGEWFGWVLNLFGQDLVRLSFGDDLGSDPIGLNIGNVGNLYESTGFTTYQQGGEWYILVANGNSLTRLHFGALLSNIPTGVNLGEDPNFDKIRDIIITKKCGRLGGLVLNGASNEMVVLDFQGDITNTPFSFLLPEVEGFGLPHSFSNIIMENNNDVLFVPNVNNNNLSRFLFESCNAVSPPNGVGSTPPVVSYSDPGEYIIELVVDKGLTTESGYCKSVLVVEAKLNVSKDTIVCQGQPVELMSNISNTTWPDGSKGRTFTVRGDGLYIVHADSLACHLSDSVWVSERDCQNCLIFPNAFTPDGDNHNDSFAPLHACPNEIVDFELKIFNRWGVLVFRSNRISDKWDGMFQGKPAPAEVYIWQVQFSVPDIETGALEYFSEVGDLTLIR